MNLLAEVEKLKKDGYSEANAEAKLCQDIIIKAISESSLVSNVTIKGGVVMSSLSGNIRRATQDIDLDFIKYSISEDSIKLFVDRLNCLDGIRLEIISSMEELKHQDYKGKRVHIKVEDQEENTLTVKVDIGVHKDLNIEQEEYCFDVCFQEDSAIVFINSKEQMVTEKLKSLLRFGTRSTRYKDIFDICYLSDDIDMEKLRCCIKNYIFNDPTLNVDNFEEIQKRFERIFTNSTYKRQVGRSKKNWLDLSLDEVIKKNLEFIYRL